MQIINTILPYWQTTQLNTCCFELMVSILQKRTQAIALDLEKSVEKSWKTWKDVDDLFKKSIYHKNNKSNMLTDINNHRWPLVKWTGTSVVAFSKQQQERMHATEMTTNALHCNAFTNITSSLITAAIPRPLQCCPRNSFPFRWSAQPSCEFLRHFCKCVWSQKDGEAGIVREDAQCRAIHLLQ